MLHIENGIFVIIPTPASFSSYLARDSTLALEVQKILVVPVLCISWSCKTAASDVDIGLNVFDQAVFADVVVLGPDEPKNREVHVAAVEVLREFLHDVDLNAPDRVFVEWVPADRHNHGEDRSLIVRNLILGSGRVWGLSKGLRWRQAGPAEVDARFDV